MVEFYGVQRLAARPTDPGLNWGESLSTREAAQVSRRPMIIAGFTAKKDLLPGGFDAVLFDLTGCGVFSFSTFF
jgi:hypothetical protein